MTIDRMSRKAHRAGWRRNELIGGVAAQQGFIHHRAPVQWRDGFPLGNGEFGVMLWGDGHPLAMTLDKSDLWDLRVNGDVFGHPDYSYAGLCRLVEERKEKEIEEIFRQRLLRDNPVGPTKISIGRAELDVGAATAYECRLDLAKAQVTGTIETERGKHDLIAFVHRERNVLCLRVTDLSAAARMNLLPLARINDGLSKLNFPPPRIASEGAFDTFVQVIPEGVSYAAVWSRKGSDILLAVASAATADEARAKAIRTCREASEQGFDALRKSHEKAWENFWSVSAVCLPERDMEFLWYYGVYLLASSARKGAIPPGLQGVWAMDGVLPPWQGDFHANIDLEETFWPACASGHLDLLDCWCDHMLASQDRAKAFTRRFFGSEGVFWPCGILAHGVLCLSACVTVQFAWSSGAFLGSLLWLRWRYSLDSQWLKATGYPVIAEIFKFYRANLRRESDGKLHVPLSSSPEYAGETLAAWAKDPNIDIALIRRCCDWVVEMEAALGSDDLSESARQVRADLVPYHLTEKRELCLWRDHPLDESHRHPSHLMAIHPAMDLTMDGDEETRRIVQASVQQYYSMGQYGWAGHTYAQMVSMAAVIGRAEMAYDALRIFAEQWIGPNGLHRVGDVRKTGHSLWFGYEPAFCMEANCGISAGIGDMLLQGWGDVLRVFPAVPERWRDVAFRDLLAEGAFRVSAVRRAGRTVWVRIVAGMDRALALRNPFDDADVSVEAPAEARLRRDGDRWVADLKSDQAVSLTRAGESLDPATVEEAVHAGNMSLLGLR